MMTSIGRLLVRACSVLRQLGDAILVYADSTKGGPRLCENETRELLDAGHLQSHQPN